ncbi:hypothetical protein QEG73_04105 [Chitinophagaceae bacterium 26-R-25]|nr:hypothetical protein [Chitinophagaceae bacterium 26-R-25]
MQLNLVKELQKYMGTNINKIDPNTQDLKEEDFTHRYDKLAQASVPTVLTVLYKYTHTRDGGARLLKREPADNVLPDMLGSNYTEVVNKVADYSGFSEVYTAGVLDNLALQAVKLLHEQAGNDPVKAQSLLADQRHEIFAHLPASIELGKALDDTTIDDRTNKMEGPVSNLLHTIENFFASSPVKK